MQQLDLPTYQFKFRNGDKGTQIFDVVRKKYVALTPEEWVRQNFIRYLIDERDCPASLMSVEKGMVLNDLRKRSDIVVHDQNGAPALIVECKAPSVTINQAAFDQIARYNMVLRVRYLVVTNGLRHFYCLIDHKKESYDFLKDIPKYALL